MIVVRVRSDVVWFERNKNNWLDTGNEQRRLKIDEF